jgi:hypothetical protein
MQVSNASLTPRVLQPSSLKGIASRDSERKTFKEEKHVIHFLTSVISLGYLASSIREANLVMTLSDTYSSW